MTVANTTCKFPEDNALTPKHVGVFFFDRAFSIMKTSFLSKHSTVITSRREHIHNNILTDQYNGFVTLKDFELPDDGFD